MSSKVSGPGEIAKSLDIPRTFVYHPRCLLVDANLHDRFAFDSVPSGQRVPQYLMHAWMGGRGPPFLPETSLHRHRISHYNDNGGYASMAGWTFLTNHAVVLSLIAKNPRITALELAMTIRITERAVRRIIANLTESGYISKTKRGRGLHYHINTGMPLRHHTHREVAVVEFLKALGWKNKKNPEKKKKEGDKST